MLVAYTSTNLEQLLEQGARAYINHPRGVVCQDGTCTFASIYVWFQEDFGGDMAGWYSTSCAMPTRPLRRSYRPTVVRRSMTYDWRLNAP